MSTITHISDTALWVAHYRAEESLRCDALFQDPLAASLVGERGPEIARAMPYPKMMAWIMAVRTVAIDRLIGIALGRGVDTVLNIGAGLDTRPYRMDLAPNLKWIEIDFPEMIAMKTEKLKNEKPRCRLERFSLDFSDRTAARSLYSEIASRSQNTLVITEGVVIYLSPEQARDLALDLHAVSNFQYWIQDYRDTKDGAWRTPRKFQNKMKKTPFKFLVPDSIAFFESLGWKEDTRIYSLEEGARLGRPFPLPFPWNFLLPFIPKKTIKKFNRSSGYVLFKRN